MRTSLKLIAILGALAALALAGCGSASSGGGGGGNEVDLGVTSFAQTSVTISAGQAVHFVDPQSGGNTHNLCIGTNGQCSGSGPSELQSPGMMLVPGDTKDVTFPTAGTFTVTCTIHPSMLLTVTVQ